MISLTSLLCPVFNTPSDINLNISLGFHWREKFLDTLVSFADSDWSVMRPQQFSVITSEAFIVISPLSDPHDWMQLSELYKIPRVLHRRKYFLNLLHNTPEKELASNHNPALHLLKVLGWHQSTAFGCCARACAPWKWHRVWKGAAVLDLSSHLQGSDNELAVYF